MNLYGIAGAVVRDLADFDHPSTVCSIPACDNIAGCQAMSKTQYVNPLFAGSGRLSYFAYDVSGFALFVFDMRTGSSSTELASHSLSSAVSASAWSPDGTGFTYLLIAEPGVLEWHLVFRSRDKTIARFDHRSSGTAGTYIELDGFSADGQYVAESDNLGMPAAWRTRILRATDGSTAKELAGASEAVWGAAGSRLYFQNGAGVQVWNAATNQLTSVLPNYLWTRPHASADGKRIVFTTSSGSGIAVLDLATGKVLESITSARFDPRFLTSDLIWSRAAGSDQRYIFDLATGKEFPSIDYLFFDSFPHTLGQLST